MGLFAALFAFAVAIAVAVILAGASTVTALPAGW
jgi:hypothetical protein